MASPINAPANYFFTIWLLWGFSWQGKGKLWQNAKNKQKIKKVWKTRKNAYADALQLAEDEERQRMLFKIAEQIWQ